MNVTDVIDAWLATKKTTLWSESFNVHSDSGRRKAAQWFALQLHELQEFHNDDH